MLLDSEQQLGTRGLDHAAEVALELAGRNCSGFEPFVIHKGSCTTQRIKQ